MSIVAALVDVSPIFENLFISLWKQLAKEVAILMSSTLTIEMHSYTLNRHF